MFWVIPEAVGTSQCTVWTACLSQFRDPTMVKSADESMQCHRWWDLSCTYHTIGPPRVLLLVSAGEGLA